MVVSLVVGLVSSVVCVVGFADSDLVGVLCWGSTTAEGDGSCDES